VTAAGAKGTVQVTLPIGVNAAREGDVVTVTPEADAIRGAWGLSRTLIANAVEGVEKGFEKRLLVVGVGYRAQVGGGKLTLNIGFSHPVELPITEGLTVTVGEQVTVAFKGDNHPSQPLLVQGADKVAVGDFAASVRAVRKPEPYKGKGIRYADERVRTDKAGKTAG